MATASITRPTGLLASLTVAAFLISSHAPPASAQSVDAEALFQAGKKLLKEGKLQEACDKFDASERLEASVGTELNAADCHAKLGELATAWALFLRAATNAKKAGNDGKREIEARKRATELEDRLSYLTISVPEANDIEGLVIKRNGEVVDPALWNTGIPVDAGEYEVSGQAPGHEAWTTKVTVLHEGDKASVEVPRFKQLAELVAKDDGKEDVAVKEPPRDPRPIDEGPAKPGMFTTMRKVSIGAAAIGLAGLAGTVVFGLQSKDLQSQSDELCPEPACDNAMAISLNDDAKRAALTSNITLGVGVVAIGGAIALWFLGAPDDPAGDEISIAPAIGGGDVGLSVAGRF